MDPALFRAMSDPTRAAIVACLAKCCRPCAVGEVAACCSVDMSVVSRHLSLLETAGVLESKKLGRTVLYSVRYAQLCQTLRSIADALEACCPAGCCSTPKGGCCD